MVVSISNIAWEATVATLITQFSWGTMLKQMLEYTVLAKSIRRPLHFSFSKWKMIFFLQSNLLAWNHRKYYCNCTHYKSLYKSGCENFVITFLNATRVSGSSFYYVKLLLFPKSHGFHLAWHTCRSAYVTILLTVNTLAAFQMYF